MDVRARTTLPAEVTAPAEARAFAREAVERGRAAVHLDDVALVVSELVTNAVLHGVGDVVLDVTVDDRAVRVEVADAAPTLAPPREAAPDGESGRGLLLVSRLARRWGVRPEGRGKVVWADLAG
ncbi:MAG TPA: ATP-binding protein [Mycobacteriales bacterium]|nr:ATP-binding protein [Mycobacteriales bacterium]